MGFGERMDCCGRFVKYGLFVTNFVLFIAAVVLFCLGLWSIIDKSFANELLGTNLFSGAIYVVIITSVCLIVLAVLGCMSAVKEVKCLLLTYFIALLLLFVTILIGGILAYVFREKVSQTMRQEMLSSLKFYGNRREITQAWDETQRRLECCGVNSYHDWGFTVPESCCQETFGTQRKPCVSNPSSLNTYAKGCFNVTALYIKDHAAIIGGAGIGVAVLMIWGIVFSCSQFNMIE